MDNKAIEVATKIKDTLEEFERTTGKPSTIHLSNATVMLLVNEIVGGARMEKKKFVTKTEVKYSAEEMATKRKVEAEHPVWQIFNKARVNKEGFAVYERNYDAMAEMLGKLNNDDKAFLRSCHDSAEFSAIVIHLTQPTKARYRYTLTEIRGTTAISGYSRAEDEAELKVILCEKFHISMDDWDLDCSIVRG